MASLREVVAKALSVHGKSISIEETKRMTHKDKKPYLRLVTKELLEQLTESDRQDFQKRYGADLSESASLEEIAKQFDITRQRIREIEAKALRKLKDNPNNEGPESA